MIKGGPMPYLFSVQEKKRIRVIVDTDAACEADDQFAIVHALLTPRFIVKGIVAEQFAGRNDDNSVDRSYDEIQKLLKLMDIDGITVAKGCRKALESELDAPDSEGVQLIIEEALREDDKPLFVLCQGAITNVAAALNRCPEIAGRMTVIWIGGGFYPDGGWEFNLLNDYHAANVVFKSAVELWQVPMDCYTTMRVGYAELQLKVMPCGEIGKYLFRQMVELGLHMDWVAGEGWSLGDSPAVGIALNHDCGHYEMRPAPLVNEKGNYIGTVDKHIIRVYRDIDSRYILEDLFAKLALNYRN